MALPLGSYIGQLGGRTKLVWLGLFGQTRMADSLFRCYRAASTKCPILYQPLWYLDCPILLAAFCGRPLSGGTWFYARAPLMGIAIDAHRAFFTLCYCYLPRRTDNNITLLLPFIGKRLKKSDIVKYSCRFV